jgi:hypothetical protein
VLLHLPAQEVRLGSAVLRNPKLGFECKAAALGRVAGTGCAVVGELL